MEGDLKVLSARSSETQLAWSAMVEGSRQPCRASLGLTSLQATSVGKVGASETDL